MEKSINVKSSSNDGVYTVVFKIDNNLLSINCNCQAGLVKTLCKHRISLMDGDVSALVSPSDSNVLTEVLAQIDKSKVSNLFTELNSIENEIKKLDALKKKLRKEIGFKISNGF